MEVPLFSKKSELLAAHRSSLTLPEKRSDSWLTLGASHPPPFTSMQQSHSCTATPILFADPVKTGFSFKLQCVGGFCCTSQLIAEPSNCLTNSVWGTAGVFKLIKDGIRISLSLTFQFLSRHQLSPSRKILLQGTLKLGATEAAWKR